MLICSKRGTIGDQPSGISISQITSAFILGQSGGRTDISVLATMITDILLIVSPIVILRSARLDPGLQFRLVAAVSTSVIATIFTVIHAVVTLTIAGLWAAVLASLEVRMSIGFLVRIPTRSQMFMAILVCNFYVMILTIMVGNARREVMNTTSLSTIISVDGTLLDPVLVGIAGVEENHLSYKI